MALFDTSGLIYTFFTSFTNNVSGSWFLTFLILTIILLVACASLRLPIEFSILLVFPLSVYFVAISSAYMSVLGVMIIYLAFLIAKNFFFWR